eukprot:4639206-Pyramimonas_sp.AAC.1
MQESGGEPSRVERLKTEAQSRKHFMTHLLNNPYCPTCTWATTLRMQQRQKQNKSLKKLKPFSEPKVFGCLCTMDHWFALDELSRGLCGETSRPVRKILCGKRHLGQVGRAGCRLLGERARPAETIH